MLNQYYSDGMIMTRYREIGRKLDCVELEMEASEIAISWTFDRWVALQVP